MLSDLQRRMYEFIKEYIQRKRVPPSYREIKDGMGFKYIRSVEHHLNKLQEENLIVRNARPSRCIELVESERGISVKGTIAAGQLLQVFTDGVNEQLSIEIIQPGSFYALLVVGDSMQGDNIYDGDYVLVLQP
jgi:repressor LexA